MAQIMRVTSEALQATIRRLLPSQQGFGEDLQASNVITPIIDLTPTAEGSSLPYAMSTALSFGDATTFNASSATVTLASAGGFYRVVAALNFVAPTSGGGRDAFFTLSDGSSSKVVWNLSQVVVPASADVNNVLNLDFTFFLTAADTLSVTTNSGLCRISGSIRQIADVNGNLTPPAGFSPQ